MFFEIIAKHQLNIMLVLSGVCAILAVFVLFLKTMSPRRKTSLILMDISAGLLLVFDRYAYMGLTGEHCVMNRIVLNKSEETAPDVYAAITGDQIAITCVQKVE